MLKNEFPNFIMDVDNVDQQALFLGEMVFPWMFEQYPQLVSLREVAELLAQKEDWPMLYDVERLRRNEVPVVAVVYEGDMFVEMKFSLETAAVIQNLKVFRTNDFFHSGLYDSDCILLSLSQLNALLQSRPLVALLSTLAISLSHPRSPFCKKEDQPLF